MEQEILTTSSFEKGLDSNYEKLTLQVSKIFSSIEKLNQSFVLDQKEKCSKVNSNMDIQTIQNLFDKYFKKDDKTKEKLISQIASLLNKINAPEKLKEDIKTGADLRFLLIVLAIEALFQFQNREATSVLTQIIGLLSSAQKRVLARWLQPMTDVSLLKRVESIQTLLSIELLKLMPDQEQPDFATIQKNILNLCKTLELFFMSNQKKQRISYQHFLNSQITQNVDPLSQIKMSLKNKNGLNFTKFPFLLDLDYKNRLLQMEYKIQQMISLEKGIQDVTSGMLSQVDLSGNLTLDKILYLHFEVRRDNILQDSITKLSQTKSSLKKPLRIAFTGEVGIDEGGVKAQYFQLITKQILNPFLGMFVPKSNNRLFWFNGNSLEPPINFQFVGILLGLSIYNSIHLDLPFPKVIYKKLLSKQNEQFNSLEDLVEVQPDIKNGLQKILESQDLSQLELTFEVSTQSFGETIYYNLKPNGSNIQVTKQNRKQYVDLYAEYLLNKHIEKQFNAFKRGFFKVVTGHMIKTFFYDQLEKVICGDPVLDFQALQKSTEYEGYTSQSKIVKWFWGIVQKMDLDMKKTFLFFCTGSDRSPIKGLGSLGFVIQRQGPDTDNLPTAHTCNNVFMLPQYNSEQKLRQKLQLAIKNNVGFGLI